MDNIVKMFLVYITYIVEGVAVYCIGHWYLPNLMDWSIPIGIGIALMYNAVVPISHSDAIILIAAKDRMDEKEMEGNSLAVSFINIVKPLVILVFAFILHLFF